MTEDASRRILDSRGEPISARRDSGTPRTRRWTTALASFLGALIAGGLLTAVVGYVTSVRTNEIDSERLGYDIASGEKDQQLAEQALASQEPEISVTYWLGPKPEVFKGCITGDYRFDGHRTACEDRAPSQYLEHQIHVSPGHWSYGPTSNKRLRDVLMCPDETCSENLQASNFGVGTVWIVLRNESAYRHSGITIDWLEGEVDGLQLSPNLSDSFELVSPKATTEQIGDLEPLRGIMLPVASVAVVDASSSTPYIVSVGEARKPLVAEFLYQGDTIRQELRPPVDGITIIDPQVEWMYGGG